MKVSGVRTERQLRWVIFTTSIISSVDNPEALLWRSLGGRLRRAGHQAVFFESRGNKAVRMLLQRDGSQALKEFRARFPDIEYRTYGPRHGANLVEWMTRILATVDVAVIQANVETELVRWLGELTRPHLQTFLLDSGWRGTRSPANEEMGHYGSYTALLVGDRNHVETYARLGVAERILWFGPLPSIDQTVDSLSQPVNLADACDRLIEIVTAALAKSSLKTGSHNGAHRP